MHKTLLYQLKRTVAEEAALTGTELMIETWERFAILTERECPGWAYACRIQAAILRGQVRISNAGKIQWILPEVRRKRELIDEIFEREAKACGASL